MTRLLSPKLRFYLIGLGLPLGLAVFWSGRNTVALAGHYRQIFKLRRLIQQRTQDKSRLESETQLLEANDPAATRRVLRQETHALFPGEIEYRFQER